MITNKFKLPTLALFCILIFACSADDGANPNQTSNGVPCNGGTADLDLDGSSIEINCLGGTLQDSIFLHISVQEGDSQMDGHRSLVLSINNYQGAGTYVPWAKVSTPADPVTVNSPASFALGSYMQQTDGVLQTWIGQPITDPEGSVTIDSDSNGKIKGSFDFPVLDLSGGGILNLSGTFEAEKL